MAQPWKCGRMQKQYLLLKTFKRFPTNSKIPFVSQCNFLSMFLGCLASRNTARKQYLWLLFHFREYDMETNFPYFPTFEKYGLETVFSLVFPENLLQNNCFLLCSQWKNDQQHGVVLNLHFAACV